MTYPAAEALGEFKDDLASHILPNLLTLISTKSGKDAYRIIRSIQANCKFYNYEIWQDYLTALKTDPTSQNHDRPPIIYHLPNATEVKIFEQVDHYHQNP